MKLDRTTYEAWLLDRLEGNLTLEQERELDAFLLAHPELVPELSELPSVRTEKPAFDGKAVLKKDFPPAGMPDAARLIDFLAARLEHDLSTEQEHALDRYLYEHPEAQLDAKRMAVSKVEKGAVPFPEKGSLERRFPPQGVPDRHRLSDFFIAAREGGLSAEQGRALERYVEQHPEAALEQRLFALAHVPQEEVVFPGKAGLRKREPMIVPLAAAGGGRVIALWPRLAAAASVALVLGLAWWILRDPSRNNSNVADKDVPSEVPPRSVQQAQKGNAPRTSGDPSSMSLDSANAPSHSRVRIPAPTNEVPQREPQLAEQVAPVPQVEKKDHEGVAPSPGPPVVQPPAPMEPTAQLAQASDPAPSLTPVANERMPGTEAGVTVGAFVANTVRTGVLETGARDASLDRNDALAMVDKGLNALTGGDGGVQVQRTGLRERLRVRLGRNLSISASRGR